MDGLRRHTADPQRAGGPAQGNAGDTRFSRTLGGPQDSVWTAGLCVDSRTLGGQQDSVWTAGLWGDSRTLGGQQDSGGTAGLWDIMT